MTEVYGGLWFENLVVQDKYFVLQCELFEKGLIQGIQLRVAHPSFTPGVTIEMIPVIFHGLPEGLKVVLHFGAENNGVDFGENWDECGEFKKRGGGRSWQEWNEQSVSWGLEVAAAARKRIPKDFPWGNVHAGYGKGFDDFESQKRILDALGKLSNCMAIENVPPVVEKNFYADPDETKYWSREKYWGFGGTFAGMAYLLSSLGAGWRCLIDFTHLFVTVFQARVLEPPILSQCKHLDSVVGTFLDLPHWPVCHFSGIPPTLTDNHDYLSIKPPESIREAIAQMEAVCLEIPWKPQTAEKDIESFRENCGIF